jgi:glycosyltransferase involved in cell wall biosynthesis
MGSKPLLGYLVSHPIQYQAPFFRRLAASSVLDFVALFGCDFGVRPSFDPQYGQVVDYGVDLLGGYRSVFLEQAPRQPAFDRFLGLRTPSLGTVWDAEPLDITILHGWRTAMMWQAAASGLRRGRPYMMRAETPVFRTGAENGGVMKQVRGVAVGALVRGAAGALALGAANERFYLRKGYPRERIYRVRVRMELGVPPDAFLIIAAAKLIPRKRPLDLVRLLPALPERVHLMWIGSGQGEDQVRSEATKLGVDKRVHLAGFRPSSELWRTLGASDLFALPAEDEPWGLVINEAVAAGLPALASTECGAAEDLIAPDRTGEIVPVGDLGAWTSAIRKWMNRLACGDGADQKEMRRLADAHSVESAAAATEAATLAILSTK